MSRHGDLNFELTNGYNVGQELCLGALNLFVPVVNRDYVSKLISLTLDVFFFYYIDTDN